MVQRAKGVSSSTLRPSGSLLHQDGKMKMKMKKKKKRSLSFDVETTTQGKSRHVLPNYMRSTTSSDARKESSLVTRLAESADTVSSRRCSKGSPRRRAGSSGSAKCSPSSAARSLKRSSSLKVVRTLIKAPSYKPARSISVNKRTQVVVCAGSSMQKATCSSTLKKTKYPECIMLNPGGTEAEGKSIFKVCPYAYCSLNGHRHGQLPPLRRFVAARRRLLKARKSAKVVPVSPASFCQGSQGDKPATTELDFETDFFVEIYAEGEKEGSLKIGGVVCVSEDEDNRRGSPSNEGGCGDGMTSIGAPDELDDDGLKGDTETEINGCSYEFNVCSAGLQEDGTDCASYHSMPSQVSKRMSRFQTVDAMNEMVEDAAAAEFGDFREEHSQTGSEDSFEEIDRDDVTRAETMSIDLTLQSEEDETGTSTSQEDACSKTRDDAFHQDPLPGAAKELEKTADPLIYADSVSLEGSGHQDEEQTGATEHASDAEIWTDRQIPGTSSEADNHEAYSTGDVHLSEDPMGQSPKEDVNKAAELGTSISVQNGTALTSTKSKGMYCIGKCKCREELSGSCMVWRINRREKCEVPVEDPEFNPRDPNFLPIVPDPEGEKVDLRHQVIDDRRNSEEWMIDYALRRAVSKLAPARKKKVELLVAAFEKVMPDSQFEKSSPAGLTQGRPIQACS